MMDLMSLVGKADDLRPLSPSTGRLAAAVSTPQSSVEDVAAVIQYDQALTAGVLRLANSVMAASRREITTVREAVIRLGGGRILEHLVAMELHARAGTLWPDARLSHYRTRHGAEVDFVLEVDRETWGIEVKASRDVGPSALSGLASLAERLPNLARRIVIYLGPRARRVGDVEVLPFQKFVTDLG